MSIFTLPLETIQEIIREGIPEDLENIVLTCKRLHNAASVFLDEHNRRRRRFRKFAYGVDADSESEEEGGFGGTREDDGEASNDDPDEEGEEGEDREQGGDDDNKGESEGEGDEETRDELGSEEPKGLGGENEVGPTEANGNEQDSQEDDDAWGDGSANDGDGMKIDDAEIIWDVFGLLEVIAEEPAIARYIQVADLKGHESTWDDYFDPRERHLSPDLTELITSSPYLREAGIDGNKWMEQIALGRYACAHAFLLTLLPNVEKLALPNSWDDDISQSELSIIPLMDVIVRRANDMSMPEASLSKLAFLDPANGIGYEVRASLSALEHLLALQSLKEFQAGSLIFFDDGYSGIEYEPRIPLYSAQLTTVEMVGCVAGHRELKSFLSRLPGLRSFHFDSETKWYGCGSNWNAGAFLAMVQEVAGDRLEELALSGGNVSEGRGTTLTSMKGFQRLRLLEIDCGLLMGRAYGPDTILEDEVEGGSCNGGEPAFPRLVDLLPRSIETLRLYESRLDTTKAFVCISRLFEGFMEERGSQLPNLRSVKLMCPRAPKALRDLPADEGWPPGLPRDVLRIARESGAEVDHRGPYIPPFSQEFHDRFGVEPL